MDKLIKFHNNGFVFLKRHETFLITCICPHGIVEGGCHSRCTEVPTWVFTVGLDGGSGRSITVSVALVATLPISLLATHAYSPLSARLIWDICKTSKVRVKTIQHCSISTIVGNVHIIHYAVWVGSPSDSSLISY